MTQAQILRLEEEHKELKYALGDISKHLNRIDVELATIKSRLTILSAGGAAVFGGMVWALQYLLTK